MGDNKVKIKVDIKDSVIKYNINGTLKHLNTKKIWFDYGVNITNLPIHQANFIIGMLLSERVGWSHVNLELSELTEMELECLNDHVRLNWMSNPYGMVNKQPSKISAVKIIKTPILMDLANIEDKVLITNGLGKDSLSILAMAEEMKINFMSFYVKGQYKIANVWKDRLEVIKDLDKLYDNFFVIETNYLDGNNRHKIIPWWVIGIPLAWSLKSNTILSGMCLLESKTFIETRIPIRVNQSFQSFDYLSKVTGVSFINPLQAVTPYMAQQLLIERYPKLLNYQRSCMFGVPNCGKCLKCYGMYYMLKSLGMKIPKFSHDPSDFHPMARRVYLNSYKKAEKMSYEKWIDGYNFYAGELSPHFNDILLDHAHVYQKDPGPDDKYGITNTPSNWKHTITEGFDEFWRKT